MMLQEQLGRTQSSDKAEILKRLFNPRQQQLPSLPTLFGELERLLDNPFSSNRKIADLVKKDPSLVSKIMQLSNSALYGKRQEVKQFENAITYLGTSTLQNLVLQICMVRLFPFNNSDLPEFDAATFWKHALATAFYSELLAKMFKFPQSDEFYLGGLMHDLGKIMLYQYHPDRYEEAILLQLEEQISGISAEIKIFGVDHTDIGVFLAQAWQFSPTIQSIISNHHSQFSNNTSLPVAIVSLGNSLANSYGMGLPWDQPRDLALHKLPVWEWIIQNQPQLDLDPEQVISELSQHSSDIEQSVSILLTH